MRRILVLTAVVAASSLVPQAAPQQGMRQGGRGGPMPGSPLVSALDADRDGILVASEIDNAPAVLKALDRNADGRIDRMEVMPAGRGREGGGEGREGGRGRAGEPGETPATSPAELVTMLMAFDANKDGVLTKAELPERMQPIFDRSDANKDGQLTAEEIRTSAAASVQPAGMGGREGRGGERGGPGREGQGGSDLVFAALDTNHDGALSADEIGAAPAALRTLDKNKDFRLTADEYGRMGRMG